MYMDKFIHGPSISCSQVQSTDLQTEIKKMLVQFGYMYAQRQFLYVNLNFLFFLYTLFTFHPRGFCDWNKTIVFVYVWVGNSRQIMVVQENKTCLINTFYAFMAHGPLFVPGEKRNTLYSGSFGNSHWVCVRIHLSLKGRIPREQICKDNESSFFLYTHLKSTLRPSTVIQKLSKGSKEAQEIATH